MVRRSRQFGFMGASCIHPGQVPIVTEEYTPSAEEVAFARRIIEEDRKQAAAGRGSFAVDGKMIDIPVIRRAETLLRRHVAILAREARRNTAAASS
jgi:citrate lyase subunit beta/citryl-CoA lyase